MKRLPSPIVIAHRGASGYVPEHTLASYFIAIQQGADYIEPDLVSTKDGALIARHENEIGGTTDVAQRREFADRNCTKLIDDKSITGWFSEDFTLAEIKTLRARERIPDLRPANTRFDGQFQIPTFDEILALVQATLQQIGVYPETKHPTYFSDIGLPLEERLLQALTHSGFKGRSAPVFIQSFEVSNLQRLRTLTDLPLIQLIDAATPYDLVKRNDRRRYVDLLTTQGLADIATYADGIGVNKSLLIPRTSDSLNASSTLVNDAHAVGLRVHAWTFRAENAFLPIELRSGLAPQDPGHLAREIRSYLDLGIDGLFTDHPILGVQARDEWMRDRGVVGE